jgi:hypothetical protein
MNDAAAKGLLEALKAILAHVEDDTLTRVNGQCTLCYSYRRLAREAVAAAEGPEAPLGDDA